IERPLLPDKLALRPTNSPFKPFLFPRVPAESVNGEGIEQFVGKDDSLRARRRQGIPGIEPPDAGGERLQCFFLPLPSPAGWLENPVFELVDQIGPPGIEPEEDIRGQAAVVSARLEELKFLQAVLLDPARELKSEQFAKETADADAGIEISAPAGCVR